MPANRVWWRRDSIAQTFSLWPPAKCQAGFCWRCPSGDACKNSNGTLVGGTAADVRHPIAPASGFNLVMAKDNLLPANGWFFTQPAGAEPYERRRLPTLPD